MKHYVSAFLIIIFFIGCSGDDGTKIEATGTIEATDVLISAQAGGQVKKVIAEEGASVRVGDTLLVIDDTDWRYQLNKFKEVMR